MQAEELFDAAENFKMALAQARKARGEEDPKPRKGSLIKGSTAILVLALVSAATVLIKSKTA